MHLQNCLRAHTQSTMYPFCNPLLFSFSLPCFNCNSHPKSSSMYFLTIPHKQNGKWSECCLLWGRLHCEKQAILIMSEQRQQNNHALQFLLSLGHQPTDSGRGFFCTFPHNCEQKWVWEFGLVEHCLTLLCNKDVRNKHDVFWASGNCWSAPAFVFCGVSFRMWPHPWRSGRIGIEESFPCIDYKHRISHRSCSRYQFRQSRQ